MSRKSVSIQFNMDNAAFEGDRWRNELTRILRELADKIEDDTLNSNKIRDINGNPIGYITIRG